MKTVDLTQQRTIEERIARLRERLKKAALHGHTEPLTAGIIAGILDLLGDEL